LAQRIPEKTEKTMCNSVNPDNYRDCVSLCFTFGMLYACAEASAEAHGERRV